MAKTNQVLVKKIQAYLRAKEAGKAGYKKADTLLEELIPLMKQHGPVPLNEKQAATLIDKFAEKNRIGAGLGVNRYEIEVDRVADLTSKL